MLWPRLQPRAARDHCRGESTAGPGPQVHAQSAMHAPRAWTAPWRKAGPCGGTRAEGRPGWSRPQRALPHLLGHRSHPASLCQAPLGHKGKSEEAKQFSPPALSQSFCASSSQALRGLSLHLLPESLLRFIPIRWVPQSRCGNTFAVHRGLGRRDLCQRWLPDVVLVQAGLSSCLHGLCVRPLTGLLSSAAFSTAQERPWPLCPWGDQDPCPDCALRKSM